MKKLFTLVLSVVFAASLLRAEEIVVTDDGSGVGTSTWTSDNVYILDGLVFVNDGQTLTIQAGTVIKAESGQQENASALIVAKGGKIDAVGTSELPIIFTAKADDLVGSVAEKARGLWGGIIILGKGITNNTSPKQIEGINTSEARGQYGMPSGEEVENDNSGRMAFVSIRHGGTDIGEGNEINGLTLGAVGSGTSLSYIEVASNKDDGVEWFGGSPKMDHILVAYCADDSYDYDEGFSGYNQFMVAVQDPTAGDNGDRLGEHDGGDGDAEVLEPYATPYFVNCTYIGRGADAGKRVLTLRDNAGGFFHNNIYINQAHGVDIEYVQGKDDSWKQFDTLANLRLKNNIFFNVADGTAEGIFKVVPAKEDYTVPAGLETKFQASFADSGNAVTDPGVSLETPMPQNNVSGTDYSNLPEWFVNVDYKGAFAPGSYNWAAGWTLAYPTPNIETTVVIIDNGSGVGTTTWTKNNTYLLDGFVFVNDGQTLTIEAGTVVKGMPGQQENASALIVAKGGKLLVNGTADEPVIFTAKSDDLNGSLPTKARGLWGGLIMLGKASTNNTSIKNIEGIPTSETRGLYGMEKGSEVDDDSSGEIKFLSIRHGGTDIGEGNEINGLTLGACGSETKISFVEVVSNKDDGVEWFGGMPTMDHILVAYCADDSYDYDEGYRGYNQFMAAIQDPEAGDNGDRLGEHDGGDGDGETLEPYATPYFVNATYIGRGADAGKRVITMRDNAGGFYHNSVFANQAKGIDIEYVQGKDDSWKQFDTLNNLKFGNNVFSNVADGTPDGIFKVVPAKEDYTVPDGLEAKFQAHFADAGNEAADAGVSTEAPTPSNQSAVNAPVYMGLPSTFKEVGYQGAFNPFSANGGNWAGSWSLTYADVDFDSVTVGESAIAPINDFEAIEVSIYPMPVSDYATVSFENQDNYKHTFELYSTNGAVLRSITTQDSEIELDVQGLSRGLYIYVLRNDAGKTYSGKIVVK